MESEVDRGCVKADDSGMRLTQESRRAYAEKLEQGKKCVNDLN
jgi:hypothetical protein